ncbi:hypothetical protein HFO65_15955 [Rhizobium laguerreae]|uniref:hypothetical protein n=1 Tax=Rhizobium laguerreae TaxID=1076926 RepID=UPI001C9020E1|nr:hypothetical protein [Rhizobium laguerreae]MBY3162125.1 hypothetical protein [Rhizobium laguerreae]
MPTVNQAVFSIASAGGELDISLYDDRSLGAIHQAEKQGLVRIDAAGWGDRMIATLTNKGREITGMPVRVSLFASAVGLIRKLVA